MLNRRGVKPPGGKIWRCSSVRSILKRRKYTGTFVYGDQNAGKYFSFRDGEIVPRRKSDKKISAEPIVHPDRFEAIVDQETFERAQRKLSDRKGKTAPKLARQYLLSGLLWCGDCGGSLGGLSRREGPLYRCQTYHQSGSSVCYCNTIREVPLVEVVRRKITERYLSEAALDRLRRKIERKLEERDRPPSRREIACREKAISTLSQAVRSDPTGSSAPRSTRRSRLSRAWGRL